MMYDCLNILSLRAPHLGVIKQINLVCQATKNNANRYFKTIGEHIDPAFHTEVII